MEEGRSVSTEQERRDADNELARDLGYPVPQPTGDDE